MSAHLAESPTRHVPSHVVAPFCAAMCTGAAVAFDGPVRLVAGLLLSLYLPGQLAVNALFPRAERCLKAVLIASLSLGATMLVALVIVVSRLRLQASTVAIGLLLACAVLAVLARLCGHDAGSVRLRIGFAWRYAAAAVPALLLTALLIGQVVGAARHRVPDSYYTELTLGPSSPVVVHSLERTSKNYRYEVRVNGRISESERFTLRPDQRRAFTATGPPHERVEVRLYTGTQTASYRELVVSSGVPRRN